MSESLGTVVIIGVLLLVGWIRTEEKFVWFLMMIPVGIISAVVAIAFLLGKSAGSSG